MKKKYLITVTVSVVLLVAAILAGLNAVFTFTSVRAEFSVFSDAGREDARALQEELDVFVGKSSAFLDLEEVKDKVAKYPCFRLEAIEKQLPQTLTLNISEREETFALEKEEGGFAIFDSEGIYLYDREENSNRIDGAENILLKGFELSAEAGQRATGRYFTELLAAYDQFCAVLDNARMNVVSAEFRQEASQEQTTSFIFRMHEGTKVEINDLTNLPAEKSRAAFERYVLLEDEDKMFGVITVNNNRTGEGDPFIVTHTVVRDVQS